MVADSDFDSVQRTGTGALEGVRDSGKQACCGTWPGQAASAVNGPRSPLKADGEERFSSAPVSSLAAGGP